jgi:methionyl-tRNA synthetase
MDELIHNVLDFAKHANKYVEDTKPWILAKDNKKDHINNFLYCLANAVRVIISLLQPVLTKGTQTMINQLKLNKEQLLFDNLINFDLLDNHEVGISIPIYNRIDKK